MQTEQKSDVKRIYICIYFIKQSAVYNPNRVLSFKAASELCAQEKRDFKM